MYICLEEKQLIDDLSFKNHLSSGDSLITSYEETRAGFVSLALEKNRKATPLVAEARALKVSASKANKPQDLLKIESIRASLLTASGISDKAQKHLTDEDQNEAIQGLIDNFLEPAGDKFIEELVYRFLLIKGDSLGGSIRNLIGFLGERKFTRTILSVLSIAGKDYNWLDSRAKKWIEKTDDDSDIELHLKGLNWSFKNKHRTLVYNLTIPLTRKNVDLCLFSCRPTEMILGKNENSTHYKPEKYIALGELKGGIDPAGADEHWKTANTALERIRTAFAQESLSPYTFFIGAAIEKSMAVEIFEQLENKTLSNAANLTKEEQLISICKWLIQM